MLKINLCAQFIPRPSYDLVEMVHTNRKVDTLYLSTRCRRFIVRSIAARDERILRARVGAPNG